jgi:hypothetical protein
MPRKLTIPATLVYWRGQGIEFYGEEYTLHLDPETETPFIKLQENGKKR